MLILAPVCSEPVADPCIVTEISHSAAAVAAVIVCPPVPACHPEPTLASPTVSRRGSHSWPEAAAVTTRPTKFGATVQSRWTQRAASSSVISSRSPCVSMVGKIFGFLISPEATSGRHTLT